MSTLFDEALRSAASRVIAAAADAGLRVATVETVTGGLLAAALTETPGASKVFEKGFVLYHSDAKATGLGADPGLAATHGAVSAPVTAALAEGLREHSGADVGVAVTGYAGPTGGNDRDPVGTVYLAGFRRGGTAAGERSVFGGDRLAVRLAAVQAALTRLAELIDQERVDR